MELLNIHARSTRQMDGVRWFQPFVRVEFHLSNEIPSIPRHKTVKLDGLDRRWRKPERINRRKRNLIWTLIPRDTRRWGDLYRGRGAVEREFGRLKHEYGLAPLRVRGIERVALHADLVMLARLSQALARARAVALAA